MNSLRNSAKGLTFIELLIVIIIIGILAGVAAPRVRGSYDDFVLGNFSKDIYYLFKYLQGNSISDGRPYCLNIDTKARQLWATYKQDNEFVELTGRFGKPFVLPQGAAITTDPPDKNTVYFYPDGSVEKISIIFTNQHKKEITLSVKGNFGEIKLQ